MLAHAHLTCWQLRRQGFQFLQILDLVELRELTAVVRFMMDLADVTFKYNFSDLDILMGKHCLYSLYSWERQIRDVSVLISHSRYTLHSIPPGVRARPLLAVLYAKESRVRHTQCLEDVPVER